MLIVGYIIQMFSTSNLLIGIIEEIDLYKIEQPDVALYGRDRIENSELINSIKMNGLLHPIVVRTKDDRFEIIAGRRRYRACKSLGFRKIICHVVELDDKESFELSLTENIQRSSLDPIEEATAFRAYVSDLGWGGLTELASKISKSTSYVCKRLSLLELPDELLEKIKNCDLSPSAAEELIPIKDPIKRHRMGEIAIRHGYSSRQLRELVIKSRESPFDIIDNTCYQDTIVDIELNAQRSFDKSITALKLAMNKISSIVQSVEDNWIIYEILMQHKNMLNYQIDILIREKKKRHR